MSKKLLTPQEAATLTNIPEGDIVFLLETHALPAQVVKNKWIIERDVLLGSINFAIAMLQLAAGNVENES